MSAAVPSTVLWLPSHPTAGAISMDRYWRELERERRAQGVPEGWWIESPLGEAPAGSRRGGRLARAWHKYAAYPWRVKRRARGPGVRVVHVLDHSFAHLLTRVAAHGARVVATVHDLAPLRDGAGLTASQQARFRRTVENLRRANCVLADSQHSADEAVALLGLQPTRTQVLPLGVHVERFARRTDAEKAPPPWHGALVGRRVVLSVGATIGRKNLQALPAILGRLRAESPALPVTLLRVGEALPVPLRDALRRSLGEGGLLELGLAPDDALIAAYQRADALLFPSRIEGFGFPVLEAMAAGCPVVCTNVTSLPEVGGNAALYFAPDDPAAAAAGLRRLLEDEGFHQEQTRLGRAQAERFSWAEHYRRLLEIYRVASLF